MLQALQMLQASNQGGNQVSPNSTILQLKAEIEKLTSQVHEYETMKVQTLKIHENHHLTA